MRIYLKIDTKKWEVGEQDFFFAFFSTVSFHLEPQGWGTRFPYVMNTFYQGSLPADILDNSEEEFRIILQELSKLTPDKVIWNIDNLSQSPPWGSRISTDITSLGNYFVTSDGKDLFEVIFEALSYAKQSGKTLTVQAY